MQYIQKYQPLNERTSYASIHIDRKSSGKVNDFALLILATHDISIVEFCIQFLLLIVTLSRIRAHELLYRCVMADKHNADSPLYARVFATSKKLHCHHSNLLS